MFKIPSWQKTGTTASLDGEKNSMTTAHAQISSSLTKGRVAVALSGAVLAAGVVGILNGTYNAEYVSLASEIGAVAPEAVVSLLGGSGLVTHAIQNVRLRSARKELKEDMRVNDAVRGIVSRRR
jgi:hypothetical protein